MRAREIIALTAIAFATSALAQETLQGKTLSIVIGSAPGGSYDAYQRVVARHLGRFLPGNPAITARNLPGAASIQSAHFVNEAPKDGLTLGAPLNILPLTQVLEPGKIAFDVGKFQWIGSVASPANVLATWHTTGVKTLEQARQREVVIGATTPGTTMEMYPLMANALFGTRFKVVTGYLGGADVNLAMERGEIGGRGANAHQSWLFQNPDWLRDGKLNYLFQMTLERDRAMPDTPTLLEFATTEEERQTVAMMAITELIGRSLFVAGGVSSDRVGLLRDALAKMVDDEAFRAECERAKLELDFVPGAKLQTLVGELMASPPAVVERFRQAVRSRP